MSPQKKVQLKKKKSNYYQRKNEKRKRKEIFLPMCMPTQFSPHFGEKTFLPFFFPILPKIHQTKHTLCVPIFIKSHTKKLNKRWASIPIKKRKKKEKKEEDGHLSNSSTLLICSRPVFAHFHQIPYKTVRQKLGTYQILLCYSFALV